MFGIALLVKPRHENEREPLRDRCIVGVLLELLDDDARCLLG
jgi:hypothetical protein